MRYGILPDVHDQVDLAQHIMDTVPNIDLWVHLGDYFDSWKGGVREAEHTAVKVKSWLDDGHIVNVLGNHDLSYGWGLLDRQHICSGFSRGKHKAINAVIKRPDWNKFVLHFWADGILITHAGYDQRLSIANFTSMEAAEARCSQAMDLLRRATYYARQMYDNQTGHIDHPLLAAGFDRGGHNAVGGVLWSDWNSLQPLIGVPQICGHTYDEWRVRCKRSGGADSWCIDTGLRHYAVIEDGEVSTHDVKPR